MKSSKNKRAVIMGVILVGLLIVAYKTVFTSPQAVLPSEDYMAAAATQDIDGVLMEMENINFDVSLMRDESFKSLKSLEIPLISLPVGKKNPFGA